MKFLLFVLILLGSLSLYALEDINIEGVIVDDEAIVIIDGELYKEGNVYGDYRIIKIEEQGVLLQHKRKQVYYDLNVEKEEDFPKFEIKHRFKMTNNKPPEFYGALKFWELANKAKTAEDAIELHIKAVQKAEAAMLKTDQLSRAKLGETAYDSRKYIKKLKENFTQ